MLTKHPIWCHTTMTDFPVPVHHSKGNWRPIIKTYTSSVSSSSKNVSPKGATFEEDPRTYSWKASRIVLPTLGDNDAKWSNSFLDRELFVKILPEWCQNHSKGGPKITARVKYAHDTIRPEICENIPKQCQGLYTAAQKLGKTVYLCNSHTKKS